MIDTEKLTEIINKEKNIDKILEKVPGVTFIDYIGILLEKYHLSKSQLISQSNIMRNYGYQILDGKRKPSRDKVIAFILALKCSEKEANRLLSLSNNGNLYPKVKRDALILFALKDHLSVSQTNILLDEYHLDILQ